MFAMAITKHRLEIEFLDFGALHRSLGLRTIFLRFERGPRISDEMMGSLWWRERQSEEAIELSEFFKHLVARDLGRNHFEIEGAFVGIEAEEGGFCYF